MRKFMKMTMLTVALVAVGVFFHVAQPTYAASPIQIDGNLSDWDNAPKTVLSNGSQISSYVSGGYYYFYVSMNPDGVTQGQTYGYGVSPDFWMSNAFNLDAGGHQYQVRPNYKLNTNNQLPTQPGQKVNIDLSVSGAPNGTNNTADNEGYVVATPGTNGLAYNDVFEGQVALSDLQLTDGDYQFALSGNYWGFNNYQVTTTGQVDNEAVDSDDSKSSTGDNKSTDSNDGNSGMGDNKSTDTSDGNGGNDYNNAPTIKMDGQYDDWTDIPKTKIHNPGDDYSVHDGALVQEDGNVYMYINMAPHTGQGYNALQQYNYEFSIGTKKYDLFLVNPDGNTASNPSGVGQSQQIQAAWWNNGHKDIVNGSEGTVTEQKTANNGTTTIIELKLPLSSFDASTQEDQTITMTNPSLGSQTMAVTGGSTGPIVLAASGLGIALLGTWRLRKRGIIG